MLFLQLVPLQTASHLTDAEKRAALLKNTKETVSPAGIRYAAQGHECNIACNRTGSTACLLVWVLARVDEDIPCVCKLHSERLLTICSYVCAVCAHRSLT